jgi:hypothetical protein
MRCPLSAAALIGAYLLAAPAQAAPVGAIKDFVLPAQFGNGAPVIKVQRVMGGSPPPALQPAPGNQPPVSGVQRAPAASGRRANNPPPGSGQRAGGGQRGGQRFEGGGYRQGDNGYRGRHQRDDGDDGAGVAAGVIGGLLLGAIIANEAQRGNAVDNCARRFRSYDRRSQTYVGAGGQRYSCP